MNPNETVIESMAGLALTAVVVPLTILLRAYVIWKVWWWLFSQYIAPPAFLETTGIVLCIILLTANWSKEKRKDDKSKTATKAMKAFAATAFMWLYGLSIAWVFKELF